MSWLKKGGANSKHFHGVISSKRKRNVVISIEARGTRMDDVEGVMESNFQYFNYHFQ